MKRVGLVGEDPNDTSSIKNLLEKRYKGKVQFCPLARRVKGHQLDNPKIKRSLPIEFQASKCEFIVYIRDLDAFKSEKAKLLAKVNWFKSLDAVVNKKGILLLNIWELEALILCDINTFNKSYNTSYNFVGDPMSQKEPKEILQRLTLKLKKQFKENSCPELFKQLDINLIEERCASFQTFILEFDKKITGH